MKIFRNILMTTLVVMLGSGFAVARADLSGKYTCEGYDPFQKATYQVSGQITKINDIYHFHFVADANKSLEYFGTGVFDKNDPNTLALVCTSPQDPQELGVALYKVKADGSLHAIWTMHGKEKTGTEICKKI